MNAKKPIFYVLMTIILILSLSATVLADLIFIEADSGKLDATDPMKIGSGGGAFNGKYIYGETNSEEKISYEFEIKEAGDYYLWFRLQGQADDANSFFVMVDGAGFNQADGFGKDEYYTFDMWEPSEGYEYSDANPFLPTLENHKDPDWIYNPHWHWIPLAYRDQTVDPPVRHNLIKQNFTAGKHTLDIMTREPECYLDKIIITNDLSYDPRGISGDPEAVYLAEIAAAEAAAAAVVEEVAAPEPEAPVAVVEAAPAPVAVAPPPVSAAQTSDSMLIFVLILAVSSSLFVISRKKLSNK